MARQLVVNGEVLIRVKGAAGTAIAALSELGLASSPVTMTFNVRHSPVTVDAWGPTVPTEMQANLSDVLITASLIHFDVNVLKECMRLAMGGGGQFGQTGRAGTLMGGGVDRFAAGYKFVGVNLTSPVLGLPWRFLHCTLIEPIGSWPLGTQTSIVPITFRAIPYTKDPWNSGNGALNYTVFDNTPDS